MRIIVLHRGYGCDSGCCGHAVEVDGIERDFSFSHPYGEGVQDYVRNLVTEQCGAQHVQDIDWDHCIVCDD